MRTTLLLLLAMTGCTEGTEGKDPMTAERAVIDRFSGEAGTRLVRTASNGLPGPGVAIDYDATFTIRGLGPQGEGVTHYDFDEQGRTPAPIYVFFEEGRSSPVVGQRNVVTVIPGDLGYNDLWRVTKVMVPEGYVVNSVTSYDEIVAAGYPVVTTDDLVNCPVVPEGSVARKRLPGDYAELRQGWYGGKIIQYFHFGEAPLRADGGLVPTARMHVTYAINPGQAGGGAASGYLTDGSGATHNVAAALPGAAGYAPLWSLRVYDNAAFAGVVDAATAEAAAELVAAEGLVNSPIVAIE